MNRATTNMVEQVSLWQNEVSFEYMDMSGLTVS